MLAALFVCSERRVSENSDSVAREGTTDTITSEAKWAIRATVKHQSQFITMKSMIASDVRRSRVATMVGELVRGTYQPLQQS